MLDIAPTILTLFGLPAGEDMDGKVLSQAFVKRPKAALIPSWEEVSGADGRHPPYTRVDPEATHVALERMIALGYVERPDENTEIAVRRTVRELRYNLGEAYQDAGRHLEAHRIFSELYTADADEQRFALRLFVSCQALGMHDELRRIVEDLDGRRRALFEEAKSKLEAFDEVTAERADARTIFRNEPDSCLNEDERRELARCRNLGRYRLAVTDYLKAQLLTAEKRYPEALAALERVVEPDLGRPDLLLQKAGLYLRLRRWQEARQIYERVLRMDPDNAHAYLGICRIDLWQKEFGAAAQSALDALDRIHEYPQAHFLLGRALAGMKEYKRAAAAFRAAISLNPNFPEAHVGLAALLERRLGDAASAREHRRLARRMRSRESTSPAGPPFAETGEVAAPRSVSPGVLVKAETPEIPPLEECLVVVTGLPRSGTSMLMQMLAGGGMKVISDGLRQADEDNPRGYLEFEPVKNLLKDSKWLFEGRGKAVKIVTPLLDALPSGLACRVILCERDLEEVLDSQERMLSRLDQARAATPERRRLLKDEYRRTVDRLKAMLELRRDTQLLVIDYGDAIRDAPITADRVNRFLGGGLDVTKMAAAIEPTLYRNRASG